MLLAPDDFDAFLEKFEQRVVSLEPAPLVEPYDERKVKSWFSPQRPVPRDIIAIIATLGNAC